MLSTQMSPGDHLLRAINIIGSRQEVAKLLGVSIKRLDRWLNGGIYVPYPYAIALNFYTGGQVKVEQLVKEKEIKVLKNIKINFDCQIAWLKRQHVAISSIQIPKSSSFTLDDDLGKLAQSIDREGLRHSIIIDQQNRLIFGERQLHVCQLLKKEKVFASIISLESLLTDPDMSYELRKHFALSERAAIGLALKAVLGERRGKPSKINKRLNLDAYKGRTDLFIAKQIGLGNKDSYHQVLKVIQSGTQSLIKAMDDEEISIFAAAEIARLLPEEQYKTLKEGHQHAAKFIKKLKMKNQLSIKADTDQAIVT